MQAHHFQKHEGSVQSSESLENRRQDSQNQLPSIGMDQVSSDCTEVNQDGSSDINQDPPKTTPAQKRGRKAKYEGAEHPDLIDKAKLILPVNNYDISKILELEEFKPLIGSRDLTKFVSKFILNRTTQSYSKSVKDQKSKDLNEVQSQAKVQMKLQCSDQIKQNNQEQVDERIESHNSQVNYGAKIQSEITSHYIREFMILKPQERQDFIWKIFNRNSQSLLEFLQNLKSACQENLYEIIEIDETLLKSSLILLAQRPNTEQALGLSNYIFINEPECLQRLQDELADLDKANIGIIPLMIGTFQQFKIDSQAVRLLPNTLLCLNKPFIQILKEDQGLRLIRHIPINVVGDFIQICSLSSATLYQKLDNFIRTLSEIFVSKWDFIDQEDFISYLSQISQELRLRNPLWVSKLDEISDLGKNLAYIYQEKGVRQRRDIIQDCLRADFTKLNQLLNVPNKTSDFTEEEKKRLLTQFRKLNKDSQSVIEFYKDMSFKAFQQTNQQIRLQQILGFSFLTLQKLALNFLTWEDSRYTFVNFGVGNGKTLLCSTLAALHAKSSRKAVFVIGKNEHLILRDEKRFEAMITSLGLNVNVNQYENKDGVYYMTQKHLESLMDNEDFQLIWSKSIVMIDEYDWIFFEGNVKQMENALRFFHGAERVVGFTGSSLTAKEQKCLSLAFKTQEVIFPKLSSMIGDKRIKLQQELVKTNLVDFCQRIYSMASDYCKLTPVIIVAQHSYTFIENYFRRFQQLRFFPMKNLKGTKLEAQFDSMFASKNGEGLYGVFLLNEQQGRGTDLKTSHEIEFNGGLFLIVADVFSSRSTEQILGRVGRLHRKGTYKQIIYKQGSKETPEQVIQMHQQWVENDFHMKIAALQTILGYQQWCQDDIAVQKPSSIEEAPKGKIALLNDGVHGNPGGVICTLSVSENGDQDHSYKSSNEESKDKNIQIDGNPLNEAESALEASVRINQMASINEAGDASTNLPQPSIKVKAPSTSKQSKKPRSLIEFRGKTEKQIAKKHDSNKESLSDHSDISRQSEPLLHSDKVTPNQDNGLTKSRYGRMTGKRVSAPMQGDQMNHKRKRK